MVEKLFMRNNFNQIDFLILFRILFFFFFKFKMSEFLMHNALEYFECGIYEAEFGNKISIG